MTTAAAARSGFLARRHRSYYLFIVPALIVVGAVILFPWAFTVWMSAFDWKIGTVAHIVGLDNYTGLATNQRFLESIVHTFYFTALAVVVPLVLGSTICFLSSACRRRSGFIPPHGSFPASCWSRSGTGRRS